MRAPITLLVLLCAGAASAHDADIIYAQATRAGDGTVTEVVTLTPATLMLLAPIDADGDGDLTAAELEAGRDAIAAGVWDEMPLSAAEGPCTRVAQWARPKDGYIELGANFRCGPGELTQTFRILSVLPAAYRIVLGAYGDGELRAQSFAQGGLQTLTLLGEPKPSNDSEKVRGLGNWILLGVEHIFGGIDHIAFLLAVLLIGGTWRRVLGLVTSFTLAHSITLGATALGIIRLTPPMARGVEILIAASICWVAIENLVLRSHRHRILLTFGFGLVHGFGFASVLMELGLGRSVAMGLFGFNLGVELGQACIVLLAFPLVRLAARRPTVNLWTLRLGSGAILVAGAVWMVQRSLG
ncbi:MAG: HupE/UreJ family protein [Myxococcaceae bacterium]|nr:HupE/UreJ family protein [Myxococcaceae bacterium]